MYHLKQVPSESEIRKFLRRVLFGRNIFCPKCKGWDVVVFEKRYRCKKCKNKFSLLSHTWLSNIKLSLPELWLILWCFVSQMPVKQTQKLMELSEKTIRHNFDLFRNHLPKDQRLLEAVVQLDEAYFGRFGKLALIMGKQVGSRRLAYQILISDPPARIDAINFLKSHIKPNVYLNTDGSVIYQHIEKYFPVSHTFDIHKKFEFTNTSEIEGMFGVLRTFIRRMYHHVTVKKFPEYMLEFYCRFSRPEMFKSPRDYLLNTLVPVPTG